MNAAEAKSAETEWAGTDVAETRTSVTNREKRGGWSWVAAIWLGGVGTILLAAAILTVGPGRSVQLPLVHVNLPETCMTHARFGIDCPGCGLTRSFIHAVHGDFLAAWRVNWVGVVGFVYLLCQIPLAVIYARLSPSARRRDATYARLIWWNERVLVGLAVLLALRWLARLVIGDLF